MQDFNKAIKLNPHSSMVYNNRGLTYKSKGEINKAVDDFNRAIEIDPKDGYPYCNRGIIYFSNDDIEHAINDYTKAIELDHFNAFYYRANAYSRNGDKKAAISDFEIFIKLVPNDQCVPEVKKMIETLKQKEK
jgi:tetratricopeptide (TPR) repeat protein